MLKLAIDAALPLITVQTDDTVNVGAVLSAIADMPVTEYIPSLKKAVEAGHIYYVVPIDNFNFAKAYSKFSLGKAMLIVVNPPIQHSAAFHAGVVVPPKPMIEKFVKKYSTGKNHASLLAALAGLTFEQMFQVSKLAMAKHGEYTARAVRDIRRTFFGTVRGLQMLSTEFLFYQPTLFLQEWLSTSGRFLIEFDQPLLTPRGLLFNGPPGTGKTMAAKYLARELGLPLYHLDIAGLMEKYVGESEGNLRIALKQAEQSAPCVMLIDEVEKLFQGGTDDSGVTSRMLSSILWWLQEHREKVFTVMTTNKEAAIPPELYRPGRIDSEVSFKKLDGKAANKFADDYCESLCAAIGLPYVFHETNFVSPHSHAEVVGVVTEVVREKYLKSQEGSL